MFKQLLDTRPGNRRSSCDHFTECLIWRSQRRFEVYVQFSRSLYTLSVSLLACTGTWSRAQMHVGRGSERVHHDLQAHARNDGASSVDPV